MGISWYIIIYVISEKISLPDLLGHVGRITLALQPYSPTALDLGVFILPPPSQERTRKNLGTLTKVPSKSLLLLLLAAPRGKTKVV